MVAGEHRAAAGCLRFLRVEPQLPDVLADTPAGDRLRRRYAITETAVRAALRDVYRARGGRRRRTLTPTPRARRQYSWAVSWRR